MHPLESGAVGLRATGPARISGPAAALWYLSLATDPLQTVARTVAARGPFIRLPYPRARVTGAPRAFVVVTGAELTREVLSDPATWRPVNIGPPGRSRTAVRRLARGILGMSGRQHEHYRRLLVPRLQRPRVAAMGPQMLRLAEEQVDAWPAGEPIDLGVYARMLVRTFAIGLLFGDDRERGYPIADLISQVTGGNFSWKILGFPFDVPGAPYHRLARGAEDLERRIIAWADVKRGEVNNTDLLSLIVNTPDESGCPVSPERIVGHTPTIFGAAYETCQNSLIWTLVMLEQHPKIARDLLDELRALGDAPAFEALIDAPLLDSVINESLRILPPVPQQFRSAEGAASLGGSPIPARSKVLLSGFLTNRNPELYPEPDKFQPERWATLSPSPFEFAVFSAGPRGCPGYGFAAAMLKVAVATIMTRRRIALQPDVRIDYRVGVALMPRAAVPAVLHPQDGAFAATPIRGTLRNIVRLPDEVGAN
jgi:cytochrome P450